MNKPLIITVAIAILLLALASWLYLFLFGAPQSPNDLFTDLGVLPVTSNEGDEFISVVGESEERIDLVGSPLQQLTTRPVAGFWAGEGSVRYMEQGTGHIYEINLDSGQEERISNTSIPVVTTAVFNSDGSRVIVASEPNGTPSVLIASLNNNSLTTNQLPPRAQNYHFTSTSTIAYTLTTTTGTTGYRYDAAAATQREFFTTPLQAIVARYRGETAYLAPKVATELEGAVFTATAATTQQVSSGEFGLVFTLGPNWYLRSYTDNNALISEAITYDTGMVSRFAIPFIPEKCAWAGIRLFCAAPLATADHTYIETWYQGTQLSNDVLWEVSLVRNQAELLVIPESTVGRPLDIDQLAAQADGTLFFRNRIDNALWLYAEVSPQ